ncbi:PqqD family peptide modification chaperone [Calothrix sp. CCY 0018]|uniref:PqqD family peptide modification chaperone n=1 Tax=Calothrix sp. CCY 0018 TaxID=3103864 RepID=UPI0039C6575D
MITSTTDSAISENSIVISVKNQISSDLGGEAVILNMNTGIYHGLNEVGAFVWNLIEQPQVVKDIQQMLLQEYEIESSVCTNDLLALLNDLQGAGLIEIKN